MKITISMKQGLALIAIVFVFLLIFAAGLGLRQSLLFAQEASLQEQIASQIIQVSELQRQFDEITLSLDSMLIARTTGDFPNQLNQDTNRLNRQIVELSSADLGTTPLTIQTNRLILKEMTKTSSDLKGVTSQFIMHAQQSNWQRANEIRQSEVSAVSSQLTEELILLQNNLNSSAERQFQDMARRIQIERWYWVILSMIGMLLVGATILAIFYGALQPIRQLASELERVAQKDFSPIHTSQRKDEIGELRRTLAILTEWLRNTYGSLEKRVAERTQNLERQTTQMQAVAQIGREITAARNLGDLLEQAVHLIQERFGFYHAGIFLIGEQREFAILRATTGEVGAKMIANGHKLSVGGTSLVGFTTGTGQPRIALDVAQDAIHFRNPLLPKTRSELTIPLKIGEWILGALDVQSTERAAFTEDDVAILQTMADQLSVAIQNAQLQQELQEKVSELEGIHRRQNQDAWAKTSNRRDVIGYQYSQQGILPIKQHENLQVPSQAEESGQQIAPIRVPLTIRGIEVGSIDVYTEDGELASEQAKFLYSTADRISQTLESARLYEVAKVNAKREQAINAMTAKITGTMDLETILSSALRELGKMPQVAEASVHIGPRLNSIDKGTLEFSVDK